MGCRNNVKLVDVHMGVVFPTAPTCLRAMLPSVAWPAVAASGSQQTTPPSRCKGSAKHANPPCLDGKPTLASEEHSKPAPADSFNSTSSCASDLLPVLQPAPLQSDKNIACGGGDDDHVKSTLQLNTPYNAIQQAFTRSSDFEQPTMSPVNDNTENTAKGCPDSTFSTIQWANSEPAKRDEPCKSDNPATHSIDQLPCDLPATASVAAKSPA